MDCADVGDAHGPTLFARGMVVRTEVGRRTLLGFSQRARIEPLLAVRHRRLHGTAGRRIYFGALLLGYYRRQTLVYAGKVGTGLGRDTLPRLGKKLAELKTPISPFEGEHAYFACAGNKISGAVFSLTGKPGRHSLR
jgi:hypothetical protein